MSQYKTDLEIVSELAEEIAEKTSASATPPSNASPADSPSADTKEPSQTSPSEKNKKKSNAPEKEKPTLKDLAIRKKSQNLEERKALLLILAILLGIQLLFMNAIVLLIVLWCTFDWQCFRELDADVLKCIFDFTKYYVTAVLVELLGGIIFIVHSVFSEKD